MSSCHYSTILIPHEEPFTKSRHLLESRSDEMKQVCAGEASEAVLVTKIRTDRSAGLGGSRRSFVTARGESLASHLHGFQLAMAFRWRESGPSSESSIRRPFRSVTFARMAFEKPLGPVGSVAVAPR